MNKIQNSLLILIGLVFSGCAVNYQVSTNLDSKNFSEYFSPAKVRIYTEEQEITNHYKNLGLVEGEACQTMAHHQLPDEIDARTDARKKAYQQGANAIIFTGCTLIENNQADKKCVATRVCYGRIFVEQRDAK